MRYDIAIIGTGPGGVSAAITSKIRNKNILLIGSNELSKKLNSAEEINNYPGFPKVKGSILKDALKTHLDSLGIEITEDRINAVYAMGDYFMLQGKNSYESTSVILACGMENVKSIDGEEDLVGNGVSYCATCDGALYKNKEVMVVGYNDESIEETEFLAELCSKVTFIPMGKVKPSFEKSNIEIKNQKPIKIKAQMRKRIVEFEDNSEMIVDCVFILRDAIKPGTLVPGLETENSNVVCSKDMSTNIPGCFVCGDIAGAPYQYIKAAGEGNIAALSAVKYITNKK